jgi:hypothetical protein
MMIGMARRLPYKLALALLIAAAALQFAGARACADDSLVVTDAIAGTGAAGPYTLTWSKVEKGNEWVSRNAIHLVGGIDYTLDANAGTIAFARSLLREEMARVTYVKRPDAVKRLQQPQDMALTLGAVQFGSGSLNLTARYNPGASGALIYGLEASAGSQEKAGMRASFAMSQPRSTAGSGPLALGWMTAGQANLGALRLSGSVAQAEQGFAQAASWGLASGGAKATISAEYRPGNGISLTSSHSLISNQSGRDESTAYGLEVAAGGFGTLAASRTEQVQGGGTSVRQKLEVRAKPGKKVDLRAEQSSQDSAGAQLESQAVGVALRPVATMTLSAGWKREQAGSEIQGRTASVAWSPFRALSLEGEYAENPPDQSGRLQPASVSRMAVTTQIARLSLRAQMSSRQDAAGLNQSRDLSLLVGLPGKSVLTAGWSESDLLGTLLSRGTTTYNLGYTLGPKSDLSFSLAGKLVLYDETESLDRAEQQVEAKLTARF